MLRLLKTLSGAGGFAHTLIEFSDTHRVAKNAHKIGMIHRILDRHHIPYAGLYIGGA